MEAYRQRIYFWLAIAGALLFLPFCINNFVQGRTALGFATTGFVVALGMNALAVWIERQPPIPAWLLFILVIGSLSVSIPTQGLVSIFWCYPAIILFHFVLSRRVANTLNVALIMLMAPMTYIYIGPQIAVRFVVTLSSVVVFNNIFSGIIEGLQQQLHELAIVDGLTRAYNRRYFDVRVAECSSQDDRQGLTTALIVMDIDHFKSINDRMGHQVGDAVLAGIVRTLRERLRAHDLIFRTGGEEFALLVPNTSLQTAIDLAEYLRVRIGEAPLIADRAVTVSAGVAIRAKREPVDNWIKRADQALYRSKHLDRNRVSADTFTLPSQFEGRESGIA